jgi:hypothetical protein
MNIYKFIDPLFSTKELYDLYLKLMTPVFPYMELDRPKTYFQLRFDTKKQTLRQYYNAVRGYNDSNDLDYYEEKYTKVWKLSTGMLYYFWIGEENGRTGDPDDYYHVYKFIPNNNSEYSYVEDTLMKAYPGIHNIVFSMMTPGSILSWHSDQGFLARWHHVLDNDAKTPSMIFKKPNEDEVEIPAKPGDSFIADVSLPHCVPPSSKHRVHLLACLIGKDFTGGEDNKRNRHGFLMEQNITWADWKKTNMMDRRWETSEKITRKYNVKETDKEGKWVTVKIWRNKKLITKKVLLRKFNK